MVNAFELLAFFQNLAIFHQMISLSCENLSDRFQLVQRIFFCINLLWNKLVNSFINLCQRKNKASEMSSSHFLSKHKYFIGKMLEEKISSPTTPTPSSTKAKTIRQWYLRKNWRLFNFTFTVVLYAFLVCLPYYFVVMNWWTVIVDVAAVTLLHTGNSSRSAYLFGVSDTGFTVCVCVCACEPNEIVPRKYIQ